MKISKLFLTPLRLFWLIYLDERRHCSLVHRNKLKDFHPILFRQNTHSNHQPFLWQLCFWACFVCLQLRLEALEQREIAQHLLLGLNFRLNLLFFSELRPVLGPDFCTHHRLGHCYIFKSTPKRSRHDFSRQKMPEKFVLDQSSLQIL